MTSQCSTDPGEFGKFPAVHPTVSPPPVSTGWFFVKNGVREGPMQESAVTVLIQQGDILRETLVWTFGMQGWIPAAETKLAGFFFVPPPLTGKSAVDGWLMWIIALLPIFIAFPAGSISEWIAFHFKFLSPYRWGIYALVSCVLCLVDAMKIRKAGHDITLLERWFWILPIYMYQRAKKLQQVGVYLVVWIIVFSICSFFG